MAQAAGWICHARAHVNLSSTTCRQTFAKRPKNARQPPRHDAEWIRRAPESDARRALGHAISQNGSKSLLCLKAATFRGGPL